MLRASTLILLMTTATAWAVEPPSYDAHIARERAERVERLTRPDGWLSLVGLHWLSPGTHRLGSDPGSDVVLATGPAVLGTLAVEDAHYEFTPATGVDARIDGAALDAARALASDQDGAPTRVDFDQGQSSFTVIRRGDRVGLRVRDARAPTRTGFAGLSYFPTDATWRIEARFEPHPPGRTIDIANVLGQLEPMANPGAVHFSRDGRDFRLEAVDEGDGRLFLIFADRTNARETYGAGRFLYADPATDGRTVVDFNLAYNPPCVFTDYSTCPLPPPGNRLDLAVTAGERRYEGAKH